MSSLAPQDMPERARRHEQRALLPAQALEIDRLSLPKSSLRYKDVSNKAAFTAYTFLLVLYTLNNTPVFFLCKVPTRVRNRKGEEMYFLLKYYRCGLPEHNI